MILWKFLSPVEVDLAALSSRAFFFKEERFFPPLLFPPLLSRNVANKGLFKWEWMIVALLGLAMTSANLYGYLRCRWADTTQFTNYLSKWAFLSVLRRQNPSTSDPMQQTI
ncbi:hypothetical protein ANCCAN_26688 [Ancylostoma caninum]|uniref:Uncharacterized protein n=1 Tax=Ancylostoma caninum TaxID=29170 RepID=A0A368F7M1_ANCCA|nr:hypothetical protein ANCCAN_26688 [Ancylostoma caninum]